MFWNSFGSIVNLGCQWALNVLIVRLSNGFDSAGIYSLAVSVYAIFAPIAQYRMYTYQVSDVRNENTTGEYLAFRVLTNAVALIVCMIYACVTCPFESLSTILLYSFYKSITLLIDVFHACDQRNGRMDYMGKSLAMQGALSSFSFVFVYITSHSLDFALLSMSIAVALVGIVYDFPKTKQFGPIVPRISCAKAKYLSSHCLPIVLAGIAASATPSLPRQFLADYLGSAALGVYASVAAPVAIIQMGASYIYNPLLSYFSERYANGDKKGFLRLFFNSLLAIAFIGICASVLLEFIGTDFLILIFGENIRQGASLLTPLVIFAIFTGVQWFLNDILISIREFRGTFLSSLVSLIICLIGAWPCIHYFGSNGVTVIGLISCLIGILIMLIYLRLHLASLSNQ